jgi:hypothetical protein
LEASGRTSVERADSAKVNHGYDDIGQLGAGQFLSARTGPRFETRRHVASSKSGDESPQSKVGEVWPTIPVAREPVAAAITPDGKFLLVANQLQAGRVGPPIQGLGWLRGGFPRALPWAGVRICGFADLGPIQNH